MRSFLTKLFAFSLIITVADVGWNIFVPDNPIPGLFITLAFFILLTLLFHYLIIKASKGNPSNFIRVYMGSTALRMFVCILVIIVYIVVDKAHAMAFSLAFMIHYLIFTAFEVASLMKDLKSPGKKE